MSAKSIPVIFRRFRSIPRDVIAIFPEIPADWRGYECTTYQHVGQHGGGDRHQLIRATKAIPPDSSEYMPLYVELCKIGYENLKVRQRITPAMDRARMATAKSDREAAEKRRPE